MKESASRMERITYKIAPHKHVDGTDTIFATMAVSLVKISLGKWIGLIRRGIYQESAEYIRW